MNFWNETGTIVYQGQFAYPCSFTTDWKLFQNPCLPHFIRDQTRVRNPCHEGSPLSARI